MSVASPEPSGHAAHLGRVLSILCPWLHYFISVRSHFSDWHKHSIFFEYHFSLELSGYFLLQKLFTIINEFPGSSWTDSVPVNVLSITKMNCPQSKSAICPGLLFTRDWSWANSGVFFFSIFPLIGEYFLSDNGFFQTLLPLDLIYWSVFFFFCFNWEQMVNTRKNSDKLF